MEIGDIHWESNLDPKLTSSLSDPNSATKTNFTLNLESHFRIPIPSPYSQDPNPSQLWVFRSQTRQVLGEEIGARMPTPPKKSSRAFAPPLVPHSLIWGRLRGRRLLAMGPLAQAHSGFPLSMSCLQDFLRMQGNKKSSLQTDKSGKSREEAVGKKVGLGGTQGRTEQRRDPGCWSSF